MKRFLITIILGLIIFSLPAFSSEVHQYSVNVEIFGNNTIHYKLNLLFIDQKDIDFSILVISPENLAIDDTENCKISKKVLGTEISCFIPFSANKEINIEYDSEEGFMSKDGYILFSDSYRLSMDVKTLYVIIKLPEGSVLKEPIENSYTPANALKGSDGRRLILNWLKNDLKQEDRFDISIAFEKISETNISSLPIETLIVIIIGMTIGFIFIYKFYLSKRFLKIVLPILKQDEKKVFDCLIKHGDGVKQKLIVRDSGYSKAKVSKVLKSLSERGIIKLERIGRSNKVYMDKNFKNKT